LKADLAKRLFVEIVMRGSSADLELLLGDDWRHVARSRRSHIASRIGGRTDVILFGAGPLGKQARRDLSNTEFTPLAFVDNRQSLWGSQVDGLEVVGPNDAAARFGQKALWLITIYTNSRVIDQCRSLGVPWVTCAELSWVLQEPHGQSFLFGMPEHLAESAPEIISAADIWADQDSAAEYLSQVRWRFLLDYSALSSPRPTAETYFPDDLIRPIADEVYVDCGAFTGDTIEVFLAARDGRFGQIIAIEPDRASIRVLRGRIDEWSREGIGPMRVAPFGAAAYRGTARFDATGTVVSSVGSGADTIDVAPLDEILDDCKPSYIKFDVEGAERDALVGGSETIRVNMPVLAVSLYHKPEDLWDLPLLIRSLAPDYRLYLRRYSDERWETICYAVPVERLRH
jgi:FkbM family methyltransferase